MYSGKGMGLRTKEVYMGSVVGKGWGSGSKSGIYRKVWSGSVVGKGWGFESNPILIKCPLSMFS